ncbi:hypothetical protein [Microbacterium sp.]|uniref:hypothetical protein n=1 Tax=Microbacterium sp. TaxID=51671 RepID=UPI003F704F68
MKTRARRGIIALAAGAAVVISSGFAISFGMGMVRAPAGVLWQGMWSLLLGDAVPDAPASVFVVPALWVAGGLVVMIAGWAAIIHGVDQLWRTRHDAVDVVEPTA